MNERRIIVETIKRFDIRDKSINIFIGEEFERYGLKYGVQQNYADFCFVAQEDNKILGVITGKALYDEVHIENLIVAEAYRNKGWGSKLIKTVEDNFKDKGYNFISLTTFEFQAPEFYKKLGFSIDFVRENKNPKLNKYFLIKRF